MNLFQNLTQPWIKIRFLFCASLGAALTAPASTLSLAGRWNYQLDRHNTGETEQWFSRALTGSLELPGSLPGQGIGDPVTVETRWTGGIFDKSYFTEPEYAPYRQPGNIKVPFWLQPETHYVGAVWFQREVEIPATWSGRRVVLSLERPHWKTTVWFDGHLIGTNNALSVAHEYQVDPAVTPGAHRLTIRVDNTIDPDIGENSHSIADHTQGNWNGIVGRIELRNTAPVWIAELQVFPRLKDRVVLVHGRVLANAGHTLPANIRLTRAEKNSAPPSAVDARIAADGIFTAAIPFENNAPLWDEFTPMLQTLHASLENGEECTVTFGFREIAHDGRQLEINGHPLFLRGTLDCAAFPRTGYPPTDVEAWRREFATIKAHGLNHVRFHSWCPPEAAFIAADELGVYLQIESATWPNWSTTIGDGKPVDAWVDAETDRILRAYGNHPSFVIFVAGNEPGGDHFTSWLAGWVSRQKQRDARRLYSAGSGWPEIPENDLHVLPEPRIQHWGAGLTSRINHLPPETASDYHEYIGARALPVVSHEIGQWCVYPNFAEMSKYTGYLKPRNFEIFQASLAAHHMLDRAHDFLVASGKQQALCYKEDIESALRTPGMGGFQLLSLADFPGQGTALVGVLDAFWEDKGYITAAEFHRFCSSTVPLARLSKRVFTTGEALTADIEVTHFGAAPLEHAQTTWKLVSDDQQIVASGKFGPIDIPIGAAIPLGHIDQSLKAIPSPARYKLVVSIAETSFENDWDVWIYPSATASEPSTVTIVREFNADTVTRLNAGGTVLLMIPPDRVAPDPKKGTIALGFSSIFWNTAWTKGQAPHTFGILCDPKLPAFATFPTDSHTNWQWWYPIHHAAAMILDGFPVGLHPTVQIVDDWFTNRKLALVFEGRIGRGKLLVTSIDLASAELDPVRRQLRASLISYMASSAFKPGIELQPEQVRSLLTVAK